MTLPEESHPLKKHIKNKKASNVKWQRGFLFLALGKYRRLFVHDGADKVD